MANPWFRMYAEFAIDPKVQMMSEADQRRFIMVLCIRCSNDHVTLHDEEMAFQLRISNEEWARSKAVFLQKDLIRDDNTPTAWDKRQFVSDSSAERVRRHRENKKKITKQTCNVTATAPEADTEADTEVNQPTSSVVANPVEGERKEASPAALPAEPLLPPPPAIADHEPTRKGIVCRLLRQAGVSDAAPHHLTDDTWAQILAKRTDEEIIGFAAAKLESRQGQRTGLKYLAPGLLEDPSPITGPPGARASPRMRAVDAGRLSAARAIFGTDLESGQRHDNSRTIDITPASGRALGTKDIR